MTDHILDAIAVAGWTVLIGMSIAAHLACRRDVRQDAAQAAQAAQATAPAGTTRCIVCGEPRPDQIIAVARRRVAGLEHLFPDTRCNVAHCVDRLDCRHAATREGAWV